MRGMILAAGEGKRMGLLTVSTPKPLLKIQKLTLIERTLLAFARANITEIVINTCYLGTQIKQYLGDGTQWGVSIQYSSEAQRLETGGGIKKALPLLGASPFVVVSCDIVTTFPFEIFQSMTTSSAHLILVQNPAYHPEGDFGLCNGKLSLQHFPRWTYANIGLFHPNFFDEITQDYFPLNQLLFSEIAKGKLSGEVYTGSWYNVGTPAELQRATQFFIL